jgi:hypothetical protein
VAPPPQEGEEPEAEGVVSIINISSNLFDASLSTQSSGANITLQNATATTLTKNVILGGSQFGIALNSYDDEQTPQSTLISQNSITRVAGDGIFVTNSLLNARMSVIL